MRSEKFFNFPGVSRVKILVMHKINTVKNAHTLSDAQNWYSILGKNCL